MATRVPSTVATEPMQKASSRRPVSLMMRLPCRTSLRCPAHGSLVICLKVCKESVSCRSKAVTS